MKLRFSTIALLLLLMAVAAFVWLSSSALPEVVASHFGSSGAANGYLPRSTYIVLLLVLAAGVPLLLAVLPGAVAGDGKNLNIPNREFWLAPERRGNTVAFIRLHGLWFAAAVALFMAYIHWLVLQANKLQPPHLSTAGIAAGLVVFFVLLIVWLAVLYVHFRRHA